MFFQCNYAWKKVVKLNEIKKAHTIQAQGMQEYWRDNISCEYCATQSLQQTLVHCWLRLVMDNLCSAYFV